MIILSTQDITITPKTSFVPIHQPNFHYCNVKSGQLYLKKGGRYLCTGRRSKAWGPQLETAFLLVPSKQHRGTHGNKGMCICKCSFPCSDPDTLPKAPPANTTGGSPFHFPKPHNEDQISAHETLGRTLKTQQPVCRNPCS